jgi:hypothetical protein
MSLQCVKNIGPRKLWIFVICCAPVSWVPLAYVTIVLNHKSNLTVSDLMDFGIQYTVSSSFTVCLYKKCGEL